LFSVPVGNRVPIVEGIFSRPVLASERGLWAERVRTELSKASFPKGVRGLYVGISAVFHAVKAAGAADRVVGLRTVCRALRDKLDAIDPEDQRTIANLILVSELLEWVFDESAGFVFKREWKTEDGDFVATWTLGLFTQQHASAIKEKERTMAQALGQRKRSRWQTAGHKVLAPLCVETTQQIRLRESHMEALFEVPFVAWPLSKAHLMDLGSGEVGLYVYSADLVNRRAKAQHDIKIGEPFFEGFVAKDRVSDFASLLIKEYGLDAPPVGRPSREIIAGGATGLHREMLVSDQVKRDQMFEFVAKVEVELTQRIGRKACIRLFVPSGELEAQFELRAVQWLIGVPDIDIATDQPPNWMLEKCWDILTSATSSASGAGNASAPKHSLDIEAAKARLATLGISAQEVEAVLGRANTDGDGQLDIKEFKEAVGTEPSFQAMIRRCTFCGTISAGGGSSQLTLTGYMRNSMPQLYSMAIGNRVPIVKRLFSNPVTWEERADWAERIREGLRSAEFPKGLCGFYVGISAMYHAAKLAGVADRLVPKQEVVSALATALTGPKAADARTVANLTLVKEIVDWVFDADSACLLFKRNWTSSSGKYVAGWTLGWYASQFEGDDDVRQRSVITIQRIERGRQARKRLQAQVQRSVTV